MPSCILAPLSTGESLPLREFLIARILAKVLHTGKSIGEIRSLAQQNKFLGNLHISLNHSRYIDVTSSKTTAPMKNKSQPQEKQTLEEFYQNLTGLINQLLAEVRNFLPSEPEILPVMTYDDAMRYFVTQRPKDPKVKKGAIMRQRSRHGQLFIQIFLDKDNQLVCQPNGTPYGRQLTVKKLDKELNEAFGDDNLIVVE